MLENHRRGLAWRVGAVTATLILVVLWRTCVSGPAYVVQVEFGVDPDFLTGAEVVIDGETVGTLERFGDRTVTGFPVDEGDHTAALRVPGCTSERARFTSGFGGRRVGLAWYPDVSVQGRDTVCVLRLVR